MKKLLFIICFLITVTTKAQDFSIKSSGVSYNKGNIDTELLMELIQAKQQEVKKEVFYNLVIKNFQKIKKDGLQNFTTYYYMYNVFDILTSGKNKRLMNEQLLERSLEFSYVYALAFYCYAKNPSNGITNPSDLFKKNFTYYDKILPKTKNNGAEKTKSDGTVKTEEIEVYDDVDFIKDMSLYVDAAFDVLLTGTNSKVKFSKDLEDEDFKRWYEFDNKYVVDTNSSNAETKDKAKRVRSIVVTQYSQFLLDAETFIVEYKAFKNLFDSKATQGKITREQFDAIRKVLTEVLELNNNFYENNIVSEVLEMMLDNTYVEYKDDTNPSLGGSISINVESVIAEVDDRFTKYAERVGFAKYVMPLFDIGATNSILPNNKNTLGENGTSINSLYFASEKIGIKWKIWNWKYTRSQPTGVRSSYYFRNYYWNTPQKRPIVSDFNAAIYVSGILYNVADLINEKSFNYALVGGGLGFTFFNALTARAGVAIPFTNKAFKSNNLMYTFSFDIPLAEYISALTKKRKDKN